jgi:hypothetical protein
MAQPDQRESVAPEGLEPIRCERPTAISCRAHPYEPYWLHRSDFLHEAHGHGLYEHDGPLSRGSHYRGAWLLRRDGEQRGYGVPRPSYGDRLLSST